MDLFDQRCIPCKKGTAPMTREKAHLLLKEVPGWHISEDGKWLHKSATFKNFAEALRYVNVVGDIAEQQNHHPDIELGWGYVRIRLQTHAAGGLHENDFIVAAKIGAL